MAASKRPPNRTVTLPNGLQVDFWDSIGVDGKPQRRRYKIGDDKLDAISTVSGIYEKWGLVPAAEKLTAEGVVVLAKSGLNLAEMTGAELLAALRQWKLNYDSVWEKARDRGDVAHDHLLHLLRDGKVAKLSDFADDLRPWIAAGMKWVLKAKPQIVDAETIVASLEHKVAGRYDLLARMRDGRMARIDFKTVTEWKTKRNSKGENTGQVLPPYDENVIQLAGYELCAVECGYQPSDVRMVVRLGPDGDYDVTESHCGPEPFLCALRAHRSRKDIWKAPEPQVDEAVAA